jgi:hypothetical protein
VIKVKNQVGHRSQGFKKYRYFPFLPTHDIHQLGFIAESQAFNDAEALKIVKLAQADL